MVELDPGTVAAIAEHSRFFDNLVDLIPARFYHGEGERLHLQSMNKSARAAAKQQFKAAYKENKRAKLDPDAPPMTALALQKAQQQQQAEGSHGAGVPGLNLTLGNASREELRAKLQQKIQAVQQQRSQKEKQAVAQQAKQWRDKTLQDNAKHKQQQLKRKERDGEEGGAQQQQQPSKQQQQQGIKAAGSQAAAAAAAAAGAGTSQGRGAEQGGAADGRGAGGGGGGGSEGEEDFQFARVQFPEAKHGNKKHGKHMSKEALLAAAEAKAKERQEAAGTAEGRVKLVEDAWKTALARAEGEKVLDDPKKLRKSLKKEAKRKEKSSKAWQERKQAQLEAQQKKQQKRTENLAARTERKIDKKRQSREKKLLRAGFEGRREGFIGSSSKKPAS